MILIFCGQLIAHVITAIDERAEAIKKTNLSVTAAVAPPGLIGRVSSSSLVSAGSPLVDLNTMASSSNIGLGLAEMNLPKPTEPAPKVISRRRRSSAADDW